MEEWEEDAVWGVREKRPAVEGSEVGEGEQADGLVWVGTGGEDGESGEEGGWVGEAVGGGHCRPWSWGGKRTCGTGFLRSEYFDPSAYHLHSPLSFRGHISIALTSP